MSSKEQANSKNTSVSRRQAARTETLGAIVNNQPIVPASAAQKASVMPRLLTPGIMLQLQRTVGNQVTSRLVAQRAQHQPTRVLQRMDSHVKQAAQLQSSTLFKSDSKSIQRTIEEDLQALEQVYQETDDPLLQKVLHEARLLSDVEFTSVNDPEEGHAERQYQGSTLAHLINLDPRITDPETRQSLILHELIHVSADRKYNVNQTGEPEPAITAVVDTGKPENERIREIGEQARYREKLATHLAAVVEGDFVVEEKAAKLVLARVPRIQGASHREFDSVITELYYRLKKMGVDERTDTFKEVAAMTAAAYRSRHEGLRLDQTYKEPMKTGFFG